MKKTILSLALLAAAQTSAAWTYQPNATIKSIIVWENSDARPLYFQRSDNTWCYVPTGDHFIREVVIKLYTTEKIAHIHCYDDAESVVGGVDPAHKVHRIIAK